jgi:F-type H+-transporting ATPase subunit b
MQINFIQIIFQVLNFGLLLFILTKFFYRPILKSLTNREKKIAAGLKAAEANLTEKSRIAQLKTKELIKAEQEAAAILATAHSKAEVVGREIVADAKTAAQNEVKKEYERLEETIQTEKTKLQGEIGRLVIDTTRSILADTLTPKDQQAIVNQQIAELQKLKSKRS